MSDERIIGLVFLAICRAALVTFAVIGVWGVLTGELELKALALLLPMLVVAIHSIRMSA